MNPLEKLTLLHILVSCNLPCQALFYLEEGLEGHVLVNFPKRAGLALLRYYLIIRKR